MKSPFRICTLGNYFDITTFINTLYLIVIFILDGLHSKSLSPIRFKFLADDKEGRRILERFRSFGLYRSA